MVALFSYTCFAQEKIVVGVTEIEPFVIKKADGTYDGITIQLWEQIALTNGYSYEYVHLPLSTNLSQVESKRIDVALGALSITNEREQVLDFTHTFYNSGLGILTRQNSDYGIIDLMTEWSFWKSILFLLGFVVAGGVLIIIFEKGTANPDFKKQRIDNGVWWSIVTITTTGYGDLVPKTNLGRIFAGVWMIFGAIIAPSLIANIAANTTIEQQQTAVKNRADLQNHKIGIIKNTSTVDYFIDNNLPYTEVQNLEHLIDLVKNKQLDAGVYDFPILKYNARQHPNVTVLSDVFDRQNYGIALQSQSDLREDVNSALLTQINKPEWTYTLNRYLGE